MLFRSRDHLAERHGCGCAAGLIAATGGVTGDVVITSVDGSIVTETNGFTYITQSDIHSISPANGQYGTKVTITGVELLSGSASLSSVTLAGVTVSSIVSQSVTEVVVIADSSASATVGDVVLAAPNGASLELVNGWTYVAKPVITGISPVEGQIGTVVTITGTTLLAGGASIDSAQLAGSPVQEVVSSNDTHVVVVAAGNTSLTVGKVLMVNDVDAEIESSTNLWTYLSSTSTINDVTPSSGQSKTAVVISGSDLFGGGSAVVSVSLAGATATIVSQNDSVVIVTAASNAAGTGAVKLTSDAGATTVLDNGFEYVAVASVDSVVPSSGQLNTVVTITGSGLLGGGSSFATVTMAGTSTTVVSGNDTHVVVRVGSGTAGVGAVVLTATSGAVVSSGAAAWTQLTDGNITSLSRSSGVLGVTVTISGTSLLGGAAGLSSVTLGGATASISSESATKVVVVAADAPAAAADDVVITATSGATVTLADGWTYLSPAQLR